MKAELQNRRSFKWARISEGEGICIDCRGTKSTSRGSSEQSKGLSDMRKRPEGREERKKSQMGGRNI